MRPEADEPEMKKGTLHTGQELREMFEAAASWLERSAPQIDALNVFPVPDGDCGTNMTLTMQSILAEVSHAPDHSASSVGQAIARGALMGARGNSGVILSQIFRGLAGALENKKLFGGEEFTAGLAAGTEFAYRALTNPTEGTILTVAREAAEAAEKALAQDNDLTSVVEAAAASARVSVANTPNLLPVLKEAGVVDAGGQGLYTLLDGMLRYLKGEAQEMKLRQPSLVPSSQAFAATSPPPVAQPEAEYGYCTEFVLEGEWLDPDSIKRNLEDRGQSLIVVGDEHLIRLHVHTFDPGSIIDYATTLGTLHDIKIQNMDDQHREFLKMARAEAPATRIAAIAIVHGDGLREVFQSLGATAIVPFGPAMTPSTQELLQAVESVPQNEVILLPNDKNAVPTAGQVPPLTSKQVAIVPTVSIPQGIAAMFSLNYEADLASNVEAMKEGIKALKTLEITEAVRSTRIGGLKVTKGQAIGFVDGKLHAAGRGPSALLRKMLCDLASEGNEVVTIYYGSGITLNEAESVAEGVRKRYPNLQVDVVYGGQPYYHYIASIE